MSVIYATSNHILISHSRELHSYMLSDGSLVKYRIKELLFDNFKRKQKEKNHQPSETRIEKFITTCRNERLFPRISEDNAELLKKQNIELLNKFYACSSDFGFFHGENNLKEGKIVKIGTDSFVIPPSCKFFNKKVEDIETFLPPNDDNKFDFIVIDPPWKNRYIKRVKKTQAKQGYFMMTDEEISEIPLEKYVKNNSVIVIWCTNSDTHIKAVRERLLVKWNLKLLSTWQWVKVDKNGELFSAIEANKKPFEQIFIATHVDNTNYDGAIEKDCLIFSQLSSIHSHKPPLIGKDLIKFHSKFN